MHGNYYGTPLAPVLETLKAGQDVLFDIDVQGAAQLYLSLPRGQYVFLLPPSLSELERRLRGRGTPVQRRLRNPPGPLVRCMDRQRQSGQGL